MNDIQMTRSGDIAISRYDIMTTDSIEQAILIKLRWFFGEWAYNSSYGVDWFGKVLVKNPNTLLVRRMIEDTIMSVDGVTSVENLTLTINRQARDATITFTVHTDLGTEDAMEVNLRTETQTKFDAYMNDSTLIIKAPSIMAYVNNDELVFTKYCTNVSYDEDEESLVIEV